MMYATEKEVEAQGLLCRLSSQKQLQFQQRFFLHFMLIETFSPELKGFCRGQQYNSLTCYTQEGSLAQKPLEFPSSSKKITPTVNIHRKKQTDADGYENPHTSHCHSPKNSSGREQLYNTLSFILHNPRISSCQSTFYGLSNYLMGQKSLVTRCYYMLSYWLVSDTVKCIFMQ